MRKMISVILLSFVFSANNTFAQKVSRSVAAAQPVASHPRLPIKRVVLYKNGVGYFEHSTAVRGNENLQIDFTTAQLNDVLKSLTVVDLGGGRIAGVRFNSVAPLGERLKALHLPVGEETTRVQFLAALRGVRVEVRSGAMAATGRLLSVESKKTARANGDEVSEVLELSLVSDSDELRSFDMSPGSSVRVTDRDINEDVSRYLDLIGSAKGTDFRRMTISATGAGERRIFVSYISEVPVWKSTYRVLLDGKKGGEALVQGWAIVDNTVGEDWKNVELSLVSGSPQSFVQSISLPYYVPRPVVPLPESVSLTPQTYEAAIGQPPQNGPGGGTGTGSGFGPGGDGGAAYSVGGTVYSGIGSNFTGVVTDQSGAAIPGATVSITNQNTNSVMTTTTDAQGRYVFNNPRAGNYALSVDKLGFVRYRRMNIRTEAGRMNQINATLNVGTQAQTVEVSAAPPPLETSEASVPTAVEEETPEAEGQGIGELFEYNIKEGVTLDKNQSALVPILQSRMKVEKVTVWNEDSEQARRTLWITNTGEETLDAGPFNVLEDGTFAGEGMLDTIRRGEKRMISYAADPSVVVSVREDTAERPYTRIRIAKGVMLMTRERRESKTYTVSNADSDPRDVIIEYPLREGWKLTAEIKPEETTASSYRFRVKVGPKQSAKLVVEERHPEDSEIALTDLNGDNVTVLADEKRLTPRMEQAFRQILEQKTAIAHLDAEIEARKHELESISSDQSRIRENMKALKGSNEEKALVERYTAELNSQEDRLSKLRSEISDLNEKRHGSTDRLDQTLVSITLDETF